MAFFFLLVSFRGAGSLVLSKGAKIHLSISPFTAFVLALS